MCGRKCILNVLHDCPICIIRTTPTRTGQLDVLKADYGCRTKLILLFYRKCSDNFEPIVVEVLNAYIVQWFIFLYPNIVCHVATLYQTSSRFNFDI